ncbi:MAG: GAF domain-containing protein, partial [Calditrichaeota bacterium]
IYLYLYNTAKRIAGSILGQNTGLIDILFLLIAMIAFQPLLNFFETLLDRFFYRHGVDLRTSLQELSQEVLTIFDMNQLREKIVNALSETLLVEAVYLMLPAGNDRLETELPERPGEKAVLGTAGEFARFMKNEKRPALIGDILARLGDENERRNLRRMRSYLLVPLLHRDNLLGLLVLGRKINYAAFSYEEMNLLQRLADQLAISLENIQLYQEKLEMQRIEEEIGVAQEIQRTLLPREWPQSPDFEICAMNIPSKEVGGDFYDFVRFGEDRLGIAIGDVSGKGIPGAILMSNLQAAFRAYAFRYPSPKRVVSQVNDHLALTTSPEKYVTFFYGVLEAKKRRFTFTNAGHNYPLLCREGCIMPIEEGDLIVGVRPGVEYRQRSLKLKPGDLILFYTDGLTEAFDKNEAFFGEERLVEMLKKHYTAPVEVLQKSIYHEVVNFCNNTSLHDDFTLVILRVK